MTERLALYLVILLVAFGLADLALTGGATLLFLARKFLVLLDHVVFWR
ncbi:glyceraldehyde-3-phosphate dehydrogenase [Pseudogemmobacter blasticus]|uniref:Glyceraldehyde-3-phosphate dehydrogenase n=1 Tax=Fuscovulum blasticum DSM 2131 TaxID=1188250 RepID=A0A2T4J5I4_FUSBL|nr:glyceraldehyde-3-phosphate dehydrogenase [Fuscovulum blasticum]PTE13152.1 glyceraldehyde-3-phosphate dehydrogenase [Fuscovulum blasticum DSM 2131]